MIKENQYKTTNTNRKPKQGNRQYKHDKRTYNRTTEPREPIKTNDVAEALKTQTDEEPDSSTRYHHTN